MDWGIGRSGQRELRTLDLGDGLRISLMRTLRIPDNGEDHALPPGLDRFPLFSVADYANRVPKHWLKTEGENYFFPLYQREAMWISFTGDYYAPAAIKVGAGNIDALTGDIWDDDLEARRKLARERQNYLVVPTQHWLDGFKAGEGIIKQFVAMPLGMGYTVEGQLTGSEDFGGLQFVVYRAKPDRLPKRPAYDPSKILRGGEVYDGAWMSKSAGAVHGLARKRLSADSGVSFSVMEARLPSGLESAGMTVAAAPAGMEMGLGMGGKMTQVVNADGYGYEVWDQEHPRLLNIWMVNSMMFREITGQEPPSTPVSAQAYSQYGLPWFSLYDEQEPDLKPGEPFKKVKTVKEMDSDKGFGPQQDDSPVVLKPGQVVHIPKAAWPNGVAPEVPPPTPKPPAPKQPEKKRKRPDKKIDGPRPKKSPWKKTASKGKG